MKVEVTKSSSSHRDFAALLDYFAAIDENLARRFMTAVDETLEMIAGFPDLGNPFESRRPRLKGLRFWNVRGFENYLLVYAA